MTKTRKNKGWSANQLSIESGLDRRTIAKLMVDHKPPYSLRQFVHALQAGSGGRTDMAKARLRKLEAEASLAELDVREREQELLPTQLFFHMIVSVRQVIARSPHLSDTQKHQISGELVALDVDEELAKAIALYEKKKDTTPHNSTPHSKADLA